MLSEEQKKSLKELSTNIIRYVVDQIESCRVEEMVNDVSFTLSLYLKELAELDKPTLSELAKHMKRSKPSAKVALDKLEKKGYIRRVRADRDRRSSHIHLTEKGRKFNDAQKITEYKLYEKVSDTLTDKEIKMLIAINKKIFG